MARSDRFLPRSSPLPPLQATLVSVLRKMNNERVIIFCTTKRTCDNLAYEIARDFRSGALHGDKRQQERDMIMRAFKQVRTARTARSGPKGVRSELKRPCFALRRMLQPKEAEKGGRKQLSSIIAAHKPLLSPA